MPYLLKTEPDVYSFADLQREKETNWDGISNPAALKHLREMKSGDKLIVYHTGKERQAVGTGTVTHVAVSDPKRPDVRIHAGEALSRPRSLDEIKAAALFRESPLVKQGRLSVVPLDERQYAWLAGAD